MNNDSFDKINQNFYIFYDDFGLTNLFLPIDLNVWRNRVEIMEKIEVPSMRFEF